MLTGKNHPCSGKNSYVDKKDLKWPKNDFPDMELSLVSEKRIFRPRIIEITKTKYTLSKTTSDSACNDVLISFL